MDDRGVRMHCVTYISRKGGKGARALSTTFLYLISPYRSSDISSETDREKRERERKEREGEREDRRRT